MFPFSRSRSDLDAELAHPLNGSPPSKRTGTARFPSFTRRYFRVSFASLTFLAILALLFVLYSPGLARWSHGHLAGELGARPDLPPLYERFRAHELQLSRKQRDRADTKYLWFGNYAAGSGWGNVMQNTVLNAYLAYRANRTFVWHDYVWNEDGSDYSDYNGKPIPSRIPLSALLDGPIVGAPFTTGPRAPMPASIAQARFNELCPTDGHARVAVSNNDVAPLIGHESTAGTLVEQWVDVLRGVPDKCVEIPRDTPVVFDIWIMGDPHRLLDVWPGFAASPVLREFRWSPLVELAFDENAARISPAALAAPLLSAAPSFAAAAAAADSSPAHPGGPLSPSAAHYAPLRGLLALHIRRGDFEGHCAHLGRWSSSWVGFNSLAGLPDHWRTDADEATGGLPGDEAARIEVYRKHCFPSVQEIVRRVGEVRADEAARLRAAAAAGGEGVGEGEEGLTDVYVMTNGAKEWVAELKAALAAMGGWRSVTSSRDLVVNREQKYVKQAIDMVVGQRAQVFVGNGWSSMSGLVTMLRMANGIPPEQTRFL